VLDSLFVSYCPRISSAALGQACGGLLISVGRHSAIGEER